MKNILTNKFLVTIETIILLALIYFFAQHVPILQKGGYLMIPLIYGSILVAVITIERIFYLRKTKINSREVTTSINESFDRNNPGVIKELCGKHPGPISEIIKCGLEHKDAPEDKLKEKILEAGNYEVPKLEQHLNLLALVARVSPLLGLLGTVLGLMKAFFKIQELSGNVNAAVLAGGISEALLTTVAGLCVAIPTMIIHQLLESKINSEILGMEKTASDFILKLKG